MTDSDINELCKQHINSVHLITINGVKKEVEEWAHDRWPDLKTVRVTEIADQMVQVFEPIMIVSDQEEAQQCVQEHLQSADRYRDFMRFLQSRGKV